MANQPPWVLSIHFDGQHWTYATSSSSLRVPPPDGAKYPNELHRQADALEKYARAGLHFDKTGQKALTELGRQLFEILFPNGSGARDLLAEGLVEAAAHSAALALRLSAAQAQQTWLDLPWEYTLAPETGAFFLLQDIITLARTFEQPASLSEPRPLRRILWIRPPISSDHPTDTNIRLEAPPSAEVILFAGDFASLDLANQPVDILHVSEVATLEDDGQVVLAMGDQRFTLEDFFRRSTGHEPRFVFLEDNSGNLDGHRLARRALQLGSAAAMAFQLPIDDSVSTSFTRSFYRQLRHGDSVELAAATAQRSIAAEYPGPAWGSPVLWLQQPDTPLFLIEDSVTATHHPADAPPEGEESSDAELDGGDLDDEADSDDAADAADDAGLLQRLPLDAKALAVLRIAVDYTLQRQPSKNNGPRRLSSSALLLALADKHALLTTDADVAFFKRCLERPFRRQVDKDLSSLLSRWRHTETFDLGRTFEDDTDLPELTSNTGAILRRAGRLATASHDGPVGTRHLLAALFSPKPDTRRPPYAHKRLQRAGHGLETLRHDLFDHLQQQWPEDDQGFWQRTLVGPRPHLISRFADDRPKGVDRLFVEPYARALAAVIAAWETPQPLSIGIFGEWGSGKSFFMHLLNDAIEDLRSNATRDAQGQRVFCRSIIQIDFNAWHYAESQIWASLVDHILRSLYKPLGEIEAQAKLQKLELIGIAQQEAEARLAEAEAALLEAEKEQQQKLEKGEDIWSIEFWQALPKTLIPPKIRQDLETLQEAVGFKETLSTARLAYRQLTGIDAARTGIRAIVAELWRYPKRPLLAVALVLITLTLLSFVDLASWFEAPWWQQLGHHIFAGLTVLVAFLAPIAEVARRTWRQLTTLRDWLQTSHRRLDDRLRQELQIYHQSVEEAQRQVTALQAERDAARRELRALQTPESFSRFLRQRLGDNTYSQHLGVISAVHNDFRTLSDLLLRHKEERRQANEEQLDHADHHVDRIVLYIDDLDRCPSSTVVQVLEAIHLLLAFDLFVVVVGVDVRWVAQSLADRYPQHLRAAGSNAIEDDAPLSFQGRATPHDYLEKIFQIPFWLPPMGQQASRNLIRALTSLKPDLDTADAETSADGSGDRPTVSAPQEPAGRLPERSPEGSPDLSEPPSPVETAPPVEQAADDPSRQRDETAETANDDLLPDAEEGAPEAGDSARPPLVGMPETVAAAQALHMEDGEITYMEALAGAVGRSPRRLKRFVNVYRILKASCTPGEALRFVRDNGNDGSYRAAMTLLALTTGAPSLAAALYRLLERQQPTIDAGTWRDALQGYHRLHRAPKAETAAVHLAFDTYCRFAGRDKTLSDLQQWAPRVKRFTFRSGG